MKFTPSHRLYGLGAILLVALTICSRNFSRTGEPVFLVTPVAYPWYLLWMLPFVRSVATLPIIIWTISIFPTYYVWHLRTLGRPWVLPGWIALLEYGSLAVAALIALLRITRLARHNFQQTE